MNGVEKIGSLLDRFDASSLSPAPFGRSHRSVSLIEGTRTGQRGSAETWETGRDDNDETNREEGFRLSVLALSRARAKEAVGEAALSLALARARERHNGGGGGGSDAAFVSRDRRRRRPDSEQRRTPHSVSPFSIFARPDPLARTTVADEGRTMPRVRGRSYTATRFGAERLTMLVLLTYYTRARSRIHIHVYMHTRALFLFFFLSSLLPTDGRTDDDRRRRSPVCYTRRLLHRG